MPARILTIVSGAPSGAFNVAITLAEYFKSFYFSEVLLRKYNKAGMCGVYVIKDIFVLDYIWNLYKQLAIIKPDIIVVHGYSTHLWTKMAALFKGIPVVHVEHNQERYTPFRRWLLQKLDKYTHVYICVSQGVAKHLIAQGIPKEKVKVIYNGIDIEKFAVEKLPHEMYTVGMTARFSRQKDHMTLIKAVEYLVRERNLPIQLILQGNGKTKKKCEQYVKQHGINNSVKFAIGKLTDLAPCLDLFVLSTNYEGLPLVLCEIMAAGIPIVATHIPGVDEIIEQGKNGFLVKHADPVALAEQIEYCRLHQGTAELADITHNAKLTVLQKFAITKMCHEYKRIIDSLLTLKC